MIGASFAAQTWTTVCTSSWVSRENHRVRRLVGDVGHGVGMRPANVVAGDDTIAEGLLQCGYRSGNAAPPHRFFRQNVTKRHETSPLALAARAGTALVAEQASATSRSARSFISR